MLEEAKNYLDMGLSLLALSPNSKIPIKDSLLQPNGSTSATRELKHIKKLYETYPLMNLGIATGEKSNITVIDIDSPEAKEELAKQGVPAPKTRLHKTPRGWHIIVPYDPEIKQTAGLVDKLDIRNDGGYIVCPPSQVNGVKYEVVRDVKPIEEPELISWLKAQYALSKRTSTPKTSSKAPTGNYPDWVQNLLSNGSTEGDRNMQCASLAGYWRSQNINYDDALSYMMTYANKCTPPMYEEEVRRTLDSIWKYESTNNMFPYQDLRLSPPLMDINIANRRVFRWADSGLMVNVTRISETRRGIDAELTIAINEYVLYGPVHIDLMSTSSRTTALRALKERKEHDWASVLQHVAYLVRNTMTATGNFIDLAKVEPLGEAEYIMNPILRHGEPTLLYGHGGTGKSSLALACALSYATGKQIIPGITPVGTGNVAILDFETTEYEHNRIVKNICDGFGMEFPHGKIFYWRVAPPITDSLDKLVRLFREHDIKWYILDSVVGAAGGDPFKPEAAAAYKATQQELGVACLGISHVAADNIHAKDPKPYGSVYFYDWSRSCWFATNDQEEGDSISNIGLYQKKGNAGIHKPIYVQASFDKATKAITYFEGDPTESESLEKRISPSVRIVKLLKENKKGLTSKEIAEKMDGIPATTVRSALSRLIKKAGSGVTVNVGGFYEYVHDVHVVADATEMQQNATIATEVSRVLHPPLKGGATTDTGNVVATDENEYPDDDIVEML